MTYFYFLLLVGYYCRQSKVWMWDYLHLYHIKLYLNIKVFLGNYLTMLCNVNYRNVVC